MLLVLRRRRHDRRRVSLLLGVLLCPLPTHRLTLLNLRRLLLLLPLIFELSSSKCLLLLSLLFLLSPLLLEIALVLELLLLLILLLMLLLQPLLLL